MAACALYIEDNEANFLLVQKVLESTGEIRVVHAPTAEDALEMLPQVAPDVLLVDLDLPGMSGLELAHELKQDPRYRDLPLLAISASVMKFERTSAMRVGFAAFVEKPFDIVNLRVLVRAAIDGTLPPPDDP